MRRGRSLTFKRKRREWLYGVGTKLGEWSAVDERKYCLDSKLAKYATGLSSGDLGGEARREKVYALDLLPGKEQLFPNYLRGIAFPKH